MVDTDKERWLDVARDTVTRYFEQVAGRSKRLRGGGYRFVVTTGTRNERCTVTVVPGGEGRVSVLFSPKPAWPPAIFESVVDSRMRQDIDGPLPPLTYGAKQGRLGAHVPTTVCGCEFQTAVSSLCHIYDASGPAPGQALPCSAYLQCTR